jgi:biotin carboxylase
LPQGHAIECRINAEEPFQNFRPGPGRVTTYLAPGGPHVRMDSHLYPDYLVPPNYDSLLGKLIVWGEDRNQVRAPCIGLPMLMEPATCAQLSRSAATACASCAE